MPTPFDLLSSQLTDGADPGDQLTNGLNGGQGKTLVGLGGPAALSGVANSPVPGMQPPMGGLPPPGGPQAPPVQGPLAAIPAAVKLRIKPRIPMKKIKPRIKLKVS